MGLNFNLILDNILSLGQSQSNSVDFVGEKFLLHSNFFEFLYELSLVIKNLQTSNFFDSSIKLELNEVAFDYGDILANVYSSKFWLNPICLGNLFWVKLPDYYWTGF